MRMQSTLFLLLKLALFGFLAITSSYVHAEYYLVNSTADYYDLCSNCQAQPHRTHHLHRKKTSETHRRPRVHRSYGGLYVYYPAVSACPCCPQPHRVRSQWGDYVVFTSRPADRRHGIIEEEESSYSADLSTSDDARADLEVN